MSARPVTGIPLACEIIEPAAVGAAGAAVVIPACNEAERIAACLGSLAAQEGAARPAIYLCVNNSTDATAGIAREIARRTKLAMVLAEVSIPRGGVGRARRLGHMLARRHSPRATMFLSTDADCIVAPDWVAEMTVGLCRGPAVLGRIDVDPAEAAAFPPKFHELGTIEDAYMRLSLEFESLLDAHGPEGIGLNTAGGANLGVRRDVYRAIGGFRPAAYGEDRDLFDRIIGAGHRPIRLPRATVFASMRADCRAPCGMAAKIAARLSGVDGHLDTALVPFAAMLARHRGEVVPTPPMRSPQALRDLGALADCVERLRRLRSLRQRHAFLASLEPGAQPVPPALAWEVPKLTSA